MALRNLIVTIDQINSSNHWQVRVVRGGIGHITTFDGPDAEKQAKDFYNRAKLEMERY